MALELYTIISKLKLLYISLFPRSHSHYLLSLAGLRCGAEAAASAAAMCYVHTMCITKSEEVVKQELSDSATATGYCQIQAAQRTPAAICKPGNATARAWEQAIESRAHRCPSHSVFGPSVVGFKCEWVVMSNEQLIINILLLNYNVAKKATQAHARSAQFNFAKVYMQGASPRG